MNPVVRLGFQISILTLYIYISMKKVKRSWVCKA